MYVLNLTHSPENFEFWECADTFWLVASNMEATLMTSGNQPPGVSDSIELELDNEVTRQTSESPRVLGETFQIERIVTEYGC